MGRMRNVRIYSVFPVNFVIMMHANVYTHMKHVENLYIILMLCEVKNINTLDHMPLSTRKLRDTSSYNINITVLLVSFEKVELFLLPHTICNFCFQLRIPYIFSYSKLILFNLHLVPRQLWKFVNLLARKFWKMNRVVLFVCPHGVSSMVWAPFFYFNSTHSTMISN